MAQQSTQPIQTSDPGRNLIQKGAAVMAVVEHVPKNGRNTFHNYDYATEADIVSAVRKEMAKQGLMLLPSVEKVEWTQVATKSGSERLCTLTVRFTLTDGAESREFVVLGEGQDRGDKATYKAMTGALKYALLKLFLIPTGDDPEADGEDKPASKAAPKQANGSAPARAVPTKSHDDRVKAIGAGLTALGFKTSDDRKAKAASVLGHPFVSTHDADLASLEAYLGTKRQVQDAGEIFGGIEAQKQTEYDQRS